MSDYKPRTKRGSFYRRRDTLPEHMTWVDGDREGKVWNVVRLDDVFACNLANDGSLLPPLGPQDWYCGVFGTYTWPDADGPGERTLGARTEMKLHEFHAAGYRKVKFEDLSPKWQAFFNRYPLEG